MKFHEFKKLIHGFLNAICCLFFLISSLGLMSIGISKLLTVLKIGIKELIFIWIISFIALLFEIFRDEY